MSSRPLAWTRATFARRVQIALIAYAILNLAVVVWDFVTGGFRVAVFGVGISSWEIRKPFTYAAVCVTVAVWLRDQSAAVTTWDLVPRWSRRIAAAIAIASAAIAIHFGIFAAGGSDAYGYVSQAGLWAAGHLVMPNRLASVTPALGLAVAPVGYTLSRASGAIVPIYSPGLPLVMALAMKLGGAQAIYLVVPLLGGLAVWLTYVLADHIAGPRTAVIASFLFALSPLFIFHTLEPISDVPATAWWLAAWVLSLRSGRWTALGAGFAAAMAILTRPNLAPLALVLLVVVANARPRFHRVLLFGAPLALACLGIALLNRAFHGSMLRSGYGSLSYLYSVERIAPNLRRYFTWLVETHSPLILIAFAAPFVRRSATIVWMIAFSGVLLACYLPYFTYEQWTFLRFLLPAIPLLVILATLVVVRGIERLPPQWRGASVVVLCAAACLWSGLKIASLNVLAIQKVEHRYIDVGEYVGRVLPQNAVIITVIQSGSVRLYGDRATVRWDWVADERLDEAIAVLSAHGYEPYILLEEWEEPLFRAHFSPANVFGRVEWPPTIEYDGAPRVRVYAIADRARYLAGESIRPRPIPFSN